ncbi:hypothetical protein [Streptomyces sp. NPDC050416]|uniref:hypothetical protein n=1 Tax=Streptomyces sp. NPDC050416 TaxID=3365611 RepID=UPI00378AF6BC
MRRSVLGALAPVDDRAWQAQEMLTCWGRHRSAGAVDAGVAARAELQGLARLHSILSPETNSTDGLYTCEGVPRPHARLNLADA